MPFTVVRERETPDPATEDDDARLVSAQLLKRGVPLDRVPRVKGQNGWLYVWESREEAENAAEQLARRTRDRWLVSETDEKPSLGPLRWLRMDVTQESDGLVFALDPITQWMVEQRFPGSCRHPSVLIGTERDDDLLADAAHFLAVARQALYLLTWVPLEDLAVFGRFQVLAAGEHRVLLPPTAIA
jgi:hypothetical protein